MRIRRIATIGPLAMAIGLVATAEPAPAAMRPGGGGGFHGGGAFHGGAMPAFHGGAMPAFHSGVAPAFHGGMTPAFGSISVHTSGVLPGAFPGGTIRNDFAGHTRFADPTFARARRHAFDFDRVHDRDFDFRRHRRRHVLFVAGGPFFDYGYENDYPYGCTPYWNGYRWVYPYGYGNACGYPGYGAGYTY